MKRRLTKLVVFLVLGAIVNVAVAWGCAIWSGVSLRRSYSNGEGAMTIAYRLERLGFSLFEYEEMAAMVYGSWGYGVGLLVQCPDPGGICARWRYISAGWPIPCLEGGELLFASGYEPVASGLVLVDRPINIGGSLRNQRAVPLHPRLIAMTINSPLYSALLWLVTLGPFQVRRHIREKRGHCIKCGYDLRGAEHEVCPECGVAAGRCAVE